MKTEAEYFEQRGLPVPGVQPHEQVIHGLSLPLHLARALFADPVARARYLRVCTLQFLVILGLGLVFMQSEKVADGVDRPAPPAPPARLAAPPAPDADEEDGVEEEAHVAPVDPEDIARAARREAEKRETVENVASVLRAFGLDAQVDAEPESGRISVKIEDGKGTPSRVPPMPPLPPAPSLPTLPPGPEHEEQRAVQEGMAVAKAAVEELKAGRVVEAVRHAEVAVEHVERAERMRDRMRSLRKRWRAATLTDVEFWAALLAAMHVAQWVVIALSRDYHDAIARDVSLLTRLEPEDGPTPPRIRLNIPWLRTKMKRRWRALVLFLMGAPFLWLVTLPVPFGSSLFTVLMSLWGAWWYVVFTAAKSGRAWRDEAAPQPLFLRGWMWLTTNIPGFRWALPRRYGRFMAERTHVLHSPIASVEQQPWAYAGLSMLRAIGMIPGLKVFVRPFIPVASAHLLEARQATLPALPAPATLPVPALEPAPAPAKVASGS